MCLPITIIMYRIPKCASLVKFSLISINFFYKIWFFFILLPSYKQKNYQYIRINPAFTLQSYITFDTETGEPADYTFQYVVFTGILVFFQIFLSVVQKYCHRISKSRNGSYGQYFFKKYVRSIFNKASNFEIFIDESYQFLTIFNGQIFLNTLMVLDQDSHASLTVDGDADANVSGLLHSVSAYITKIFNDTLPKIQIISSIFYILSYFSLIASKISLIFLPTISNEDIYEKTFIIHKYVRYPVSFACLVLVTCLYQIEYFEREICYLGVSVVLVFLYVLFDVQFFQYEKLAGIYREQNQSLPGPGSGTAATRKDSSSKMPIEEDLFLDSSSQADFINYVDTTPALIPFINFSLSRTLKALKNESFFDEEGQISLFQRMFLALDKQIDIGWQELDTFQKDIKDRDITQVNFGEMRHTGISKLHDIREQILKYGKGPY